MSLFCPNCRALLRRGRQGGTETSTCPKCGYSTSGSGAFPKGSRSVPQRPDYERDDVGTTMDDGNLEDDWEPRDTGVGIGEVGEKGIEKYLFPFDQIRDGQEHFAKDWTEVLDKGGHLVAYAPTGIGKTAAALGPAIKYAKEKGLKVFFLTSKQSQHTIAVNTLKAISQVFDLELKVSDIIAKQHMCPRSMAKEHPIIFTEFCKVEVKTKHCKYFMNFDPIAADHLKKNIMHVEEAKDYMTSKKVCPHRAELDLAKEADVIVCDYNYLFSDMYENLVNTMEVDVADIVLIVDEAHNLPDRIRNHLSDDLTHYRLGEAYNEVRPLDEKIAHYLRGMRDILKRLGKEAEGQKQMKLSREDLTERMDELFSSSLTDKLDLDTFIEDLLDLGQKYLHHGALKSSIISVANFLDGWRQSTSSIVRYIDVSDGERLSYRLLDPSEISKGVFHNVRASVLMSGTLFPTQMYADLLGLDAQRTTQKEYSSPFPQENRLVLVTRGLTTLYKARGPAMYDKYGEMLTQVCASVSGNVAVFPQSYDMLSEMRYQIERRNIPKKLIVEERGMKKTEREGVLEDLRRAKAWNGAILLGVQGGSFSEGVDYRDNLLSAVLVVGMPFPPPSLEVNALKDYYSERFGKWKGYDYAYLYPAMGKVLQAAGRGIRSETDRGVVLLADERFVQPKYSRAFPKNMKPRTPVSLKAELEEFFDEE